MKSKKKKYKNKNYYDNLKNKKNCNFTLINISTLIKISFILRTHKNKNHSTLQ